MIFGEIYAKTYKVDFKFLLQKGLTTYPSIKKKQYEVKNAELLKEKAVLSRLPKIDGTVYFNYVPYISDVEGSKGQIDFGNWTFFAKPTATLTLPLYTFGKISNANRAAEYNIKLKKSELASEKSNIEYQMKKLFWSYLLASSIKENIIDRTIGKFEKIVNDREKEFIQGKIKRAKLESSKIDYYNLKKNEVDVISGLNESLRWLRMVCGASETDEISIDAERLKAIELNLKPYYYYLNLAKKYNPILKKIHYGYLARKYQYKYQYANTLPDIFFGLNLAYVYHGFDDENSILPSDGWTIYFAFGVKWELSFWNKNNQSKIYKNQYLSDLEDMKVAYEMSELQLKKIYEDLKSKKQKLFYSDQQFKAAKRWVIFSINRYESGTGSIDEAQEGYKRLFYRQKDYYSSIYDYNMAIASFEAAMGMKLINYDQLYKNKVKYE